MPDVLSAALIAVLVLYFSLIVIRAIMIFAYYINTKRDFTADYDENDFTIIQPIVSGDPNLEADLKANVERTKTMRFIWVIDKSDILAEKITAKIRDSADAIKGRITIIKADDYRKDKSAKAYKQGLAKNIKTKYSIFIDDDTIVDFGRLLIPPDKSLENGHTVITGLPHYGQSKGFFSKLVSATVNATSLAYLPMALIGRQHTINGMYYIMSTELVYKYEVFTNIEGALSDEYALAKLLADKGVTIKQNISPCLCKTTVKGAKEYFALLKRWSIFAKIYAKENVDFPLLALVAAPLFLPFLALAPLLISQSRDLMLLFALIYIAKVAINTLLHHLIYGNAQNPLAALPLEFAADMLYPIHYLRAIFGSNKIRWRDKEIEHK